MRKDGIFQFLSKWPIVLNATSHKDWATQENSILVEPTIKQPIYDNVFFKEGGEFNQGHMYTFSMEEFEVAVKKAIDKYKNNSYNNSGAKLKEKFTYKNTLDKILSYI